MYKDWYSLDEVAYCFSRSSIKFLGHMGWKSVIWIKFEWDYFAGHNYQIPHICLVYFHAKWLNKTNLRIIKSPQYTGGDYVFVPVRMPAADSCSRDNFWTTFWNFFNFWYDCWPWPVDYLIRFWLVFVMTLTYIFKGQIWNLLYLSQKCSDCHTKSKHINGIQV